MWSRAKGKIIARSLNSRSRSRSVGGIAIIQLLATSVASDYENARTHRKKIYWTKKLSKNTKLPMGIRSLIIYASHLLLEKKLQQLVEPRSTHEFSTSLTLCFSSVHKKSFPSLCDSFPRNNFYWIIFHYFSFELRGSSSSRSRRQ